MIPSTEENGYGKEKLMFGNEHKCDKNYKFSLSDVGMQLSIRFSQGSDLKKKIKYETQFRFQLLIRAGFETSFWIENLIGSEIETI